MSKGAKMLEKGRERKQQDGEQRLVPNISLIINTSLVLNMSLVLNISLVPNICHDPLFPATDAGAAGGMNISDATSEISGVPKR